MDAASRHELLDACRVIFGRQLDDSFLGHLQEAGLRAAWRLKAFETHPDLTADRAAKRQRTERFIEARRAYGLLRDHLEHRVRREAGPAPRRRQPAPAAAHGPRHRPRTRPYAPRTGGDQAPAAIIPRRRLRLGEYLYHARVIPFPTLIEALVWQRRQRDRFCEVGRRWGYLSDCQVSRLLEDRRPHERVGAAAQRLRLLTAFQVRTVLSFQLSRQEPLGNFFIQRGMLTARTLEDLLRRFDSHNTAYARR